MVASRHDEGRVPKASRIVDDGGHVEIGEVRADIIFNPGHTLGAISFVIDGGVFTGDTMFGAGCGRLFEGTADMMRVSLERLAALPPDTKVYFGHEYTASNLRFAAAIEPDNDAIRERAKRPRADHAVDDRRRARHQPVRALPRALGDRRGARSGSDRRGRRSLGGARGDPEVEGRISVTWQM